MVEIAGITRVVRLEWVRAPGVRASYADQAALWQHCREHGLAPEPGVTLTMEGVRYTLRQELPRAAEEATDER